MNPWVVALSHFLHITGIVIWIGGISDASLKKFSLDLVKANLASGISVLLLTAASLSI